MAWTKVVRKACCWVEMRGTLMAWMKAVRKAGCLVEMREILTAAEIPSNVHF